MRALLTVFGIFLISITGVQAGPPVPDEMTFGGIRLKINSKARAEIQKSVDALTASAKYFQVKVDRADAYFPIIERVLQEQGVPDDIKYLCMQESALIGDAVSSSNAVGYWQFKKATAQEVGMTVDNKVDERMHIVFATAGAAEYFKRNNARVNNWVYALLSYNVGPGGVQKYFEEKHRGVNEMKIDGDMHWYVLKFLAHKVAFENALRKTETPPLTLLEYGDGGGKSLSKIAKETNTDEEKLNLHNRWLLASKIPDDKIYPVLLPVEAAGLQAASTNLQSKLIKYDREEAAIRTEYVPEKKPRKSSSRKHSMSYLGKEALFFKKNGLLAIMAREGDSPQSLALQAGMKRRKFLKYNEMKKFENTIPGEYYYLQPKHSKATVLYHVVKKDETLASIARRYGIKQKAILQKNAMKKGEALRPGRVLYLKYNRPKDEPVKYEEGVYVTVKPKPDIKSSPEFIKNDTALPVMNYSVDTAGYLLHTIAAGETMFGLTVKYKIDIDSLKLWNGMTNFNVKPGMRLVVGKKEAGMAAGNGQIQKVKWQEHEVQSGETLYKISRLYSVSVDEILKNNEKTEPSVKVGEKLKIKKLEE